MFQSGLKVSNCCRSALGNCFDISVCEIANRPDDSRLSSRSHCEVAKAYSLNSALDYESPRYHTQ